MRGSRGVATILLGLSFALAPFGDVPDARADALSEARARQAQLQRQIKAQRSRLDGLKSDERALAATLGTTEERLDGINADQAELRSRIDAVTAELASVQARYDDLVKEIGDLDRTLVLLQDELDTGERDLADRRRLLAARLAEAYRAQQTSLLEQVLTADSFADAFVEVDTFLRFGDQDKQLAEQIERDQESLSSLRRMTAAARGRAERLRLDARDQALAIAEQRRQLEIADARLAELEAETRRLQEEQLAGYQATVNSREDAAKELAEHEAADKQLRDRIAALVAAARREQRDDPPAPAPSGNGRMRWPVAGLVTQEFGCTGFPWEPPSGSCAHFHDGIDIHAAAGTPVRASMAGKIVFSGWNPYDDPRDPAWIVTIVHSGGFTSLYAHLQGRRPPGAGVGSRVAAGQTIGYMGSTGHSSGTHVHWEVRLHDRPVNPRRYL